MTTSIRTSTLIHVLYEYVPVQMIPPHWCPRGQRGQVALDVAGAFDKVWWKALLAKLKACGCGGSALALFESYFSDRFLQVVAMGTASKEKSFTAGVPQGGIWSPLLWNFYIQDLSDVCTLSSMVRWKK